MADIKEKLEAQPKWKIIVVVVSLLVIAIIFINAEDEKKSGRSNVSSTVNQQSKIVEIKQVLNTKYFDVTVNEAWVERSVDPQIGYGGLESEVGAKYLVIDLTVKNTNTEGRIMFDGNVFIDYNGKRLKFDKTELVPGAGWGLSETLNPLMSMRTKVVYKVPAEIAGPLYYQPGRSSSGEMIHIGVI